MSRIRPTTALARCQTEVDNASAEDQERVLLRRLTRMANGRQADALPAIHS